MKTERVAGLDHVEWKDLVYLTGRERFNELALSAPWLAGSIYFYGGGWIAAGLGCSFMFFLTGLRQAHGAEHFSLGISRSRQEWVLFGLSLLMMGSMHGVQVSHLHHHRHCLDETDHEGRTAGWPWWQALLAGPLFLLGMHSAAWDLASRKSRRWIACEWAAVLLLAVYASSAWAIPAVACHLCAMMAGECCTGFFCVWTVHHDCEEKAGRTLRGRWWNRISYNMFLHREHHLCPAVPTAHLHLLAERLDSARPKQAICAVWPQRLCLAPRV